MLTPVSAWMGDRLVIWDSNPPSDNVNWLKKKQLKWANTNVKTKAAVQCASNSLLLCICLCEQLLKHLGFVSVTHSCGLIISLDCSVGLSA